MIIFLKRHLKIIALTFSIVFTLLVFIFRNSLMSLTVYGLIGLFLISLFGSSTIFLPVPVIIAAFIAGAIFHPGLVTLIVALGASLGEITGYMAGYGAGDIIQKQIRITKMEKWINKFGLWVVFFLAALPNPIFDLAGMVSGATEIPVYKFLLATFFGKLIKFGVLAYLGSNSIVLIDKFI